MRGESMRLLLLLILLTDLQAVFARGEAPARTWPSNALGPVTINAILFGLGYERAISGSFAIDAVYAASSKVDVTGARMLLSRLDTSVLLRPSLGLLAVRDGEESGPWYLCVWAGFGACVRAGPVAVVLDLSAAYGEEHSPEDGFIGLTGSLRYLF